MLSSRQTYAYRFQLDILNGSMRMSRSTSLYPGSADLPRLRRLWFWVFLTGGSKNEFIVSSAGRCAREAAMAGVFCLS